MLALKSSLPNVVIPSRNSTTLKAWKTAISTLVSRAQLILASQALHHALRSACTRDPRRSQCPAQVPATCEVDGLARWLGQASRFASRITMCRRTLPNSSPRTKFTPITLTHRSPRSKNKSFIKHRSLVALLSLTTSRSMSSIRMLANWAVQSQEVRATTTTARHSTTWRTKRLLCPSLTAGWLSTKTPKTANWPLKEIGPQILISLLASDLPGWVKLHRDARAQALQAQLDPTDTHLATLTSAPWAWRTRIVAQSKTVSSCPMVSSISQNLMSSAREPCDTTYQQWDKWSTKTTALHCHWSIGEVARKLWQMEIKRKKNSKRPIHFVTPRVTWPFQSSLRPPMTA